jgi:ligand-binding SRPBCC domain-containing protein
MTAYQLYATQLLCTDSHTAWGFHSDLRNLRHSTPARTHFRIKPETGNAICPGQVITFKITPLPVITIEWVTEITLIGSGHFLMDEQTVWLPFINLSYYE